MAALCRPRRSPCLSRRGARPKQRRRLGRPRPLRVRRRQQRRVGSAGLSPTAVKEGGTARQLRRRRGRPCARVDAAVASAAIFAQVAGEAGRTQLALCVLSLHIRLGVVQHRVAGHAYCTIGLARIEARASGHMAVPADVWARAWVGGLASDRCFRARPFRQRRSLDHGGQ